MFTTFEVEQGAIQLVITIHEALDFSQTYGVLGGSQLLRMHNGAAVKQTHWNKISTDISCSGIIPVALSEIDFRDQYLMRCGAKRAVSATNPLAMPVTLDRRTDAGYEVKGYGYVDPNGSGADAQWVETTVVDNGATVDLSAVPGASLYRAYYWPEILVFSDEPSENTNVHGAEYSWSLSAEQV